MTKHTGEGSTLALEPKVDVTRGPKQEYQWSSIKFLKTIVRQCQFVQREHMNSFVNVSRFLGRYIFLFLPFNFIDELINLIAPLSRV